MPGESASTPGALLLAAAAVVFISPSTTSGPVGTQLAPCIIQLAAAAEI